MSTKSAKGSVCLFAQQEKYRNEKISQMMEEFQTLSKFIRVKSPVKTDMVTYVPLELVKRCVSKTLLTECGVWNSAKKQHTVTSVCKLTGLTVGKSFKSSRYPKFQIWVSLDWVNQLIRLRYNEFKMLDKNFSINETLAKILM